MVAGKAPKERGRRQDDITTGQIEIFFATLADSCNVRHSAKAAGFAVSTAYRRRKIDAAFRNGWAAAVREGYARLELILLERAIKGTPKLVRTAGGSDRVMREYSTALAVALLKRHAEMADAAQYQPDEDELAEVRERILAKLEGLRTRELALPDMTPATPQDEREIEVKSMGGRVEIIRWGLRRAGKPLPPLACGESPSSRKGEGN